MRLQLRDRLQGGVAGARVVDRDLESEPAEDLDALAEELEAVKRLGVTYGQGYLLGRPATL